MSEFSHAGGGVNPQSQQRWSTRKLVTLALFTALALILSFVEFPIFPVAPFLKYDPSNVIVALAACGFGPVAGLIVGIVAAAIHGLIMGDPWGSCMTIIALTFWIVPIALIYRAKRSFAGMLVAVIVGTVLSLAAAIGGNLLITPIYTGTTMEVVAMMVIPVLLPFNALKIVINDILLCLLINPVQGFMDRNKM